MKVREEPMQVQVYAGEETVLKKNILTIYFYFEKY